MKRTFASLISSKVVLVVAAIFVVAMGIVTAMSHILIAEEAQRGTENMLESVTHDIEKSLNVVEMVAKGNSWVVSDGLDDDAFLYHVTRRTVECNENLVGCAIAFAPGAHHGKAADAPYSYRDEEGNIVSKNLNDHDYMNEDWYRSAFERKEAYWSEPYFDEGGARRVMCTYSYPILDSAGGMIGVITADIGLEWIEARVREVSPYRNSYMILASREGKLLSVASDSVMFQKDVISNAMKVKDRRALEATRKMLAGERGIEQTRGAEGLSFVVYAPLENGWSAAMVCKYKEILASCSQMHWFMLVVGLAGLTGIYLICRRTISRLSAPLSRFADSAKEISRGDFNVALPKVANCSEMMTLHDSMDSMQVALKQYIDELQTTTRANERIESELNVARNIQLGMVPHDFPKEKPYEVYALLKPAREVGGDFYDFMEKDGKLYIAAGDVSGKGMPAALVMAITKAAFRFFAGMGMAVEEIVYHINHTISEGNDSMMFVTLFAGRLDLATGELEYCNAGHNPILVARRDEEAYYLKEKANVAVGVLDGYRFEKETCHIGKGDTLLLYTDGVTEAERGDRQQFGEERLLEAVNSTEYKQSSAKEQVEKIMQHLKSYTMENEQNDDITLMSVKL